MEAIGTVPAVLGIGILVGLVVAIARDGILAKSGRNKTITALDKDWNRMSVKVDVSRDT